MTIHPRNFSKVITDLLIRQDFFSFLPSVFAMAFERIWQWVLQLDRARV